MQKSLEQIMLERNLDRTSVIKLAIYQFCKTMSRPDVQEMDLYEVLSMIEKAEPTGFMSFEEFAGE